jgi:hypothetical protein
MTGPQALKSWMKSELQVEEGLELDAWYNLYIITVTTKDGKKVWKYKSLFVEVDRESFVNKTKDFMDYLYVDNSVYDEKFYKKIFPFFRYKMDHFKTDPHGDFFVPIDSSSTCVL